MSENSEDQPAQQKRVGGGNAKVSAEQAFWLTDLYPDAAALFAHDIVPLAEVVKECIVVLDANILLWPYEYSSASLGAVEKVYNDLARENRLVIPGQAAREYYKHRSKKIAAITEKIEGAIAKNNLQVFDKIAILEGDEDYEGARKVASEIVEKGKEVSNKLRKINNRLKGDIGSDRVSGLYRDVLSNSVVDIPLGPEARAEILEDAQRRSRLEIAPGYKDDGKPDGGVGDLLIWRTILQEGERRKCHAIFVTEEVKNDWWIKSKGAFHPRPELIDEYRQRSGGKSLHLLPLSGLLAAFKSPASIVEQAQVLEDKKNTALKVIDAWRKVNPTDGSENSNYDISLLTRLSNEIADLKSRRDYIYSNPLWSDAEKNSLLKAIDDEISVSSKRIDMINSRNFTIKKLMRILRNPDSPNENGEPYINDRWLYSPEPEDLSIDDE